MTNKKAQLRKHKQIATGLFLAMVILYLLMVYLLKHYPSNWMGYVKAFSEAAMVGALADWFAVTALFRHPMGLKIPHTNLIESNKNTIGDNLGNFVTTNFLTPGAIKPYIVKLNISLAISNWLQQHKNQKRIEQEIIHLVQTILKNVDDKTIIQFLENKAQQKLHVIAWQNLASKGLQQLIEENEPNRFITLVIPKIQEYIQENKEAIYQQIITKKPLLGLIGGKSVTNQLVNGLDSFLNDILEDDNHKIRIEINTQLSEFALNMSSSEEWKYKINSLVYQFINPETISYYIESFWTKTKVEIEVQLEDNNSILRNYLQQQINDLSVKFSTDVELQNKLNKEIQTTIYKLILKNSHEVGNLISNTVAQWDGKELSEKLELEVGKDLQYIRINGTLIGGLVGLIIYTLTTFL